jgi:hypothetical protein
VGNENHTIQVKKLKTQSLQHQLRQIIKIMGAELSAKNKIQAIGSLAVPVLRHRFRIVHWHQEEMQKLDRKTTTNHSWTASPKRQM